MTVLEVTYIFETQISIVSADNCQIFTGHDPFHPERFGPTTITKIHNNHRPIKPSDPVVIHRGLDDNMWTLLQECWSGKPANRPTMVEVVDRLKCLP